MGHHQEQKGQNNYKLETIFLKSELLHYKSYAPNSQKLIKTVKRFLKSEHRDLILQEGGGLGQIIEKLYIRLGV